MPYDTNFDAVLTASDDEYVLYSAEDDKTYKSAAVLSAAESDSSEVLYSAKSVINMIPKNIWRGNALFVKDDLTPIKQNTVKQMFRKLKVSADIPRLHPHLLRHTFATRYLEAGGDIYSLQSILGHTSLEMVKKYVHLIPSKTVVNFDVFSPLDNALKK